MFVTLIRDLKKKVKEGNKVIGILIFTNVLTFGAFCMEANLVGKHLDSYNNLVDKIVETEEAKVEEEKIDIPEAEEEEQKETEETEEEQKETEETEEEQKETEEEKTNMDNTANIENLSVKNTENWKNIPLTSNSSVKSYMDGSAITYVGSDAYEVKSGLYIREDGLYTDGKYIGIAISDYYGNVGDKFRITLEGDKVFYAIMTDTKKSSELNEFKEHPDGSLIEFVIDIKTAQYSYPTAIAMGDFNYSKAYSGHIVKIERLV